MLVTHLIEPDAPAEPDDPAQIDLDNGSQRARPRSAAKERVDEMPSVEPLWAHHRQRRQRPPRGHGIIQTGYYEQNLRRPQLHPLRHTHPQAQVTMTWTLALLNFPMIQC